MNKTLLFVVLLVCSAFSLKAQWADRKTDTTLVFNLVNAVPIQAKDIESDQLGNLYVLNKTNQLYKYSKEGKLLSTLNYNYQGNITLVDPSNPLEIYVFYKELNRVAFLDNNLAYRGDVDLNNLNIGQASAIGRSFNNGLWAFDLSDLQLKRMDKDGLNLQQSGNIRQFIPGSRFNPLEIADNGNRVFLNDTASGILIFDVFCSYIKWLPITGCRHLKAFENDVYFYKDDLLCRYNFKTFELTVFKIPSDQKWLDLSIENGRLYLLSEKEIAIYAF